MIFGQRREESVCVWGTHRFNLNGGSRRRVDVAAGHACGSI